MTSSTTADDEPTITQLLNEEEVVMTPTQRRFYASDDCITARMALQHLVDNPLYNTDSSYFSGNELGFVDRHLYYLSTHPTTQLTGYISNLRLMTKIHAL